MGKTFKTQVGARINKPLDDRLQVADMTELFNNVSPTERYNGMRVYVESESKAYHFILGTNSMFYTDNLNRVAENIWIQNQLIPINVTYAELVTLATTATLLEGAYYRITDFLTKTNAKAHIDDAVSADEIEPLVVLAKSTTDIYGHAFSETDPNDTIIYDMWKDQVPAEARSLPAIEGSMTNSVDDGDTITLAITGTHTFTSTHMFHDDWEIYWEVDDGANYYWFAPGNKDKAHGRSVRKTAGGLYEITVNEPILDLTGGTTSIYVWTHDSVEARTGSILYRKNHRYNIETHFDFKAKVARYAYDVVPNEWSSLTTYGVGQMVYHTPTARMYIAVKSNTNVTPDANGTGVRGILMQSVDVPTNAILPANLWLAGKQVDVDVTTRVDKHIFTQLIDDETGTPTDRFGRGMGQNISIGKGYFHESPDIWLHFDDTYTTKIYDIVLSGNVDKLSVHRATFASLNLSSISATDIIVTRSGSLAACGFSNIEETRFAGAMSAVSGSSITDSWITANSNMNECVVESIVGLKFGRAIVNQLVVSKISDFTVWGSNTAVYYNTFGKIVALEIESSRIEGNTFSDVQQLVISGSTPGNFEHNVFGNIERSTFTNASLLRNQIGEIFDVDFLAGSSLNYCNFDLIAGENISSKLQFGGDMANCEISQFGKIGSGLVLFPNGATMNNVTIKGIVVDCNLPGDWINVRIDGDLDSDVTGNMNEVTILGDVLSSTIADMTRSVVNGDITSCTIGTGFIDNVTGRRSVCTIGTNFARNTVVGDSLGTIVPDSTQDNFVQGGLDNLVFAATPVIKNIMKHVPNATDFTLSTHIYGDYDVEFFKNSGGTMRLKYHDAGDNINTDAITA